MKIIIVGEEDTFQQHLLKNTLEAIKEIGCECQLEVIHDIKEIMKLEECDLIVTPALIVNDHILCEGHIWDKEHIKHYIMKVLNK
ncbi:MAG: thioredoxin family protein [Candidatus Omnitrophica bacterium]|nr:thioredoxin family protein [Candidatus Omnitrophota bacterium]